MDTHNYIKTLNSRNNTRHNDIQHYDNTKQLNNTQNYMKNVTQHEQHTE